MDKCKDCKDCFRCDTSQLSKGYNTAISSCQKAIDAWNPSKGKSVQFLWSVRSIQVSCRPIVPIGILTSPVFEPVFQHKEWERALGLLDEMESKEMKPDIISYDAGISACEKACEWEQAIVLLQDLNIKKLQPTIVTCSALISACGNGGEWPLALYFFDEAGLVKGRSKELGGALCSWMILRW